MDNEYDTKKNALSTYLKNKDSIIQSWQNEKFRKGRKRMRDTVHKNLVNAVKRQLLQCLDQYRWE